VKVGRYSTTSSGLLDMIINHVLKQWWCIYLVNHFLTFWHYWKIPISKLGGNWFNTWKINDNIL